MNETKSQPKKRKVFLATRKSGERRQNAFAKLHEAYDTTPKTAEKAEFIIVDLEDPIPPRDWGNSNNILLVVPGHRYPPIILAELGEKEDPNFRIVLDGIMSEAGKLPCCKTQDALLDWLYSIEKLLPFYNQKNLDEQQLDAPLYEGIHDLVAAALRLQNLHY